MAYVAVHGGEKAIRNADRLASYERLKGTSDPLLIGQIRDQLRFLVDRVMGEGSLYAPELAALAIKQAEGDPIEASFFLRSHRSTLAHRGSTLPSKPSELRLERRISSAFKDIPGGQVLGATGDYRQRLLDFGLYDEARESTRSRAAELSESLAFEGAGMPARGEPIPVVDILREQGLVSEPEAPAGKTGELADITSQGLEIPAGRDARLQSMARGETGGLLALAYSSMRGYGSVHPTIGELRVGWQQVRIAHPFRQGETVSIGEVRITEAELICGASKTDGDGPRYTIGYGACFGVNENKAISMATLDRAMQSADVDAPAQDEEFVLLHTDGIESSGFCAHFKLPHYVTFQASLDGVRSARAKIEESNKEAVR